MIDLVGFSLLGLSMGILLGIVISRRLGLTPSAKELKSALEENDAQSKHMKAVYKGRLREYENPAALSQIAQEGLNLNDADLASMLSDGLSNISGLPRWIKPFIPAIQGYVKENPDKIKELISRFAPKVGAGGEYIGDGEGTL